MASSYAPPKKLSTDPLPQIWFSEERLTGLRSDFSPTIEFYRLSGLLNQALKYWIKLEICNELISKDSLWPALEREAELEDLQSKWLQNHSLEELALDPSALRKKLLVKPATLRWARLQWEHRLESLYLEKKSKLDKASCFIIRFNNKNLATEIYHQILAGEITFESAAYQHGLGQERFRGGKLSLAPLDQMPFGIAPVLRKLKAGELTMPLRLGKGFVIIRMGEFVEARFDSSMENYLLEGELESWLTLTCDFAKHALK